MIYGKQIAVGILIGSLLGVTARTKEPSGQFVLTVVGSQGTDKLVVPPIVVMRIRPVPGTSPAPLNPQDKMICRAEDAQDQNGGSLIVVHCGTDKYVLIGLNLAPEKKK